MRTEEGGAQVEYQKISLMPETQARQNVCRLKEKKVYCKIAHTSMTAWVQCKNATHSEVNNKYLDHLPNIGLNLNI